jgi:hypothetical protein
VPFITTTNIKQLQEAGINLVHGWLCMCIYREFPSIYNCFSHHFLDFQIMSSGGSRGVSTVSIETPFSEELAWTND